MSLPVLTISQMRAWEMATWAAGVREADVIARVGEAVARKIREMVPPGSRVLLLAGRGNNGSDVRAAERSLSAAGDHPIELLDVTDPSVAQAELERALKARPALVVDGLFGIGLNRPLAPEWCRLIETVNASGLPVLAVDVPSGLDADSGAHIGAAIRAEVTLTVGAPKCGLIRESAYAFVGRLEVAAEVGLLPDPEAVIGAATGMSREEGWEFRQGWTVAADFAGFPPHRRVDSHKGSYGHLVIVAGSLGYHGAAVLAARAAGAARPGLVTVFTSPGAYPAVAAQLAFAMVRPWSEPLEVPAKASAVLVGPGLAGSDVPDWLKAQTLRWWRELPLPLIADASALDWLAAEHRKFHNPANFDELRGQTEHSESFLEWMNRPKAGGALRLITPHPGEAQRWVHESQRVTVPDRQSLLDTLVTGGIAVLKGHQTLIAGPAAAAFVNPTGNPGLAQGGSGDVLAGFAAGLLAQPVLQTDPLKTVRYAVWEHGAAADRLEAARRNWTAEDLAAEIGR